MDNNLASRIVTPEKLVQNQGAKVLVYGMAGAGKTSLAKTAPGKVLVISAEAGLLSIKDAPDLDAIEVKEASEIEEIALNHKRMIFFKDWVSEARNNFYISIN